MKVRVGGTAVSANTKRRRRQVNCDASSSARKINPFGCACVTVYTHTRSTQSSVCRACSLACTAVGAGPCARRALLRPPVRTRPPRDCLLGGGRARLSPHIACRSVHGSRMGDAAAPVVREEDRGVGT